MRRLRENKIKGWRRLHEHLPARVGVTVGFSGGGVAALSGRYPRRARLDFVTGKSGAVSFS